jgi:glutamate/tyrosine decarboxylase-like PLP-dependent enzyme
MPIRGSLYGLKQHLQRLLRETGDSSLDTEGEQRRAIDQLVEPWTLPALGELRFYQELAQIFPDERGLCERAPLVVMASNKHYSFLKTLDLLGLGNRADGRGALVEIALTDDFTLDPEALRDRLVQALERRERVLAVVSTFGTTEEGSLDDLPAIRHICEELEGRGLASWLHVDACYGGYLGALIRADEGTPAQSGAELASWIRTFACDFGLPADVADQYIGRSGEGHGWLTWDAFASRVAGMAGADSIAIDPHKLGYVPYPAGAVLLRDRAAEDGVTYDAPYLGAAEHTSPEAFVGRYTLEGSRPGAAAAACWLAHRAVPLSQQGHGKVLAASILATRELYGALEARSGGQDAVKVAFVNKPHTNMICYLPYHVDSRDLGEAGAICDAVAAVLSPTHKRDFMVVKTTVRVKATAAWMAERFDPSCAARFHAAHGTATEIDVPVLRSVVMGPLALGATTRPEHAAHRGIFDLYAEHLIDLTEQTFLGLRVDSFVHSFEPHESLLVVDDDPDVWEQVQGVLRTMTNGRIHNLVRYSSSREDARITVADYTRPLRFVVLGAGLGGGATYDADAVYEDICARNDAIENPALRVRSVVFLTAGDQHRDGRRKAIERASARPPETRDISKRDAKGDPDSSFLGELRRWLVE